MVYGGAHHDAVRAAQLVEPARAGGGDRGGGHWVAVRPPSRVSTCPVTNDDASEQKNRIAPTSGNPNNYRFGIIYAQPDPMFDIRQHCDGDLNESGVVDIDDLLAVVGAWGANCDADISPFSGD